MNIDLSDSDENILDDVNDALKQTGQDNNQNQQKMKKRNPFAEESKDHMDDTVQNVDLLNMNVGG